MSSHAQPADTATAITLDTAMHARSREHTKDEGASRAHQSSMRRTVASVAKSATPAPANRIHGDRPARDEIVNGSRIGANGRDWARLIRERGVRPKTTP